MIHVIFICAFNAISRLFISFSNRHVYWVNGEFSLITREFQQAYINNGHVPIYEPGLHEIVSKNYLSNRLKFTTNLSLAVKSSDLIFICVGTPTSKKNKSADLRYVFKAASDIGNHINKFKIIVTKSTVPVSTGDKIEKIILKKNKKDYSK